jgi:hypothetical protein
LAAFGGKADIAERSHMPNDLMPRPRQRAQLEPEPDDRLPAYSGGELQRMDERFRRAMTSAIEARLEHATTAVSTCAGTKRPVVVG